MVGGTVPCRHPAHGRKTWAARSSALGSSHAGRVGRRDRTPGSIFLFSAETLRCEDAASGGESCPARVTSWAPRGALPAGRRAASQSGARGAEGRSACRRRSDGRPTPARRARRSGVRGWSWAGSPGSLGHRAAAHRPCVRSARPRLRSLKAEADGTASGVRTGRASGRAASNQPCTEEEQDMRASARPPQKGPARRVRRRAGRFPGTHAGKGAPGSRFDSARLTMEGLAWARDPGREEVASAGRRTWCDCWWQRDGTTHAAASAARGLRW